MKPAVILRAFLLLPVFAIAAAAQAMPDSFFYDSGFDSAGQSIYQIGPKHELMLKAAREEGEYVGIALAAGREEGLYYLGLCRAVSSKNKVRLSDLALSPLSLTIDGDEVIVDNDKYDRVRNKDGIRIEMLMYGISEGLFKELAGARKVFAQVGTFDYLASAENLRSFRYLAKKLDEAGTMPTTWDYEFFGFPAKKLPLNGFYERDGYFIKWYNRKALKTPVPAVEPEKP